MIKKVFCLALAVMVCLAALAVPAGAEGEQIEQVSNTLVLDGSSENKIISAQTESLTITTNTASQIGSIYGNKTNQSQNLGSLTFSGSELLTINGDIYMSGNAEGTSGHDTLTLENSANVVVNGFISIGDSGNHQSIIVGENAYLRIGSGDSHQSIDELTISNRGKLTINGTASFFDPEKMTFGEDAILEITASGGSPALVYALYTGALLDEATKTKFQQGIERYLAMKPEWHFDVYTDAPYSSSYALLDENDQPVTHLTLKNLSDYTISTNVFPDGSGTVSGADTYKEGSTATVSATPNEGYVFSHWTEGDQTVSTAATYTFTVERDRTLTAHFERQTATLTLSADPAAGGTVSGGGTHSKGESVTVTATPNSGYVFSRWSDGNTDNPRQITVNSDQNLTAYFTVQTDPSKQNIDLNLTADPAQLNSGGSVTLSVTDFSGSGEVSLTCSDTSITPVRGENGKWTVTLPNETKNYTFTANFAGNDDYNPATDTCIVSVTANSPTPPPYIPDIPFLPDFTEPPAPPAPVVPDEPEPDPSAPCDGGADCPSRQYRDLDPSKWYHLDTDYVIESGLMTGFEDGSFLPDGLLSRAMLAQVLYNREGRPAVAALSVFSDVPPGAWYAPAVNWAAGRGLVLGYEDGTFRPGQRVTREQLAAVLWRYAGSPPSALTDLPFTDIEEASAWALPALRWAVERGILDGKGGGVLDPQGFATRAETARMLRLAFETA